MSKGNPMSNRPPLRICFFAAIFFLSQHGIAQTTPPAAPAPPAPPVAAPPPAPTVRDDFVKFGSEKKPTHGFVADIDKGDNGCYLTIKTENKSEYIEVGGFALCTQKPPLKGKHVELEYSMQSIMAGDCYGDPKCKRTETVPVITSVKIVD